jgi:hypothetical protein
MDSHGLGSGATWDGEIAASMVGRTGPREQGFCGPTGTGRRGGGRRKNRDRTTYLVQAVPELPEPFWALLHDDAAPVLSVEPAVVVPRVWLDPDSTAELEFRPGVHTGRSCPESSEATTSGNAPCDNSRNSVG